MDERQIRCLEELVAFCHAAAVRRLVLVLNAAEIDFMAKSITGKPLKVKASASAQAQPRYPKPKILLLDLPYFAREMLFAYGFNVSSGTLGKPYRVDKNSNYLPLIGEAEAPSHTEQEIAIIDLSYDDVDHGPPGEKHVPDEEPDFWGKCILGFLDPRVRTAY